MIPQQYPVTSSREGLRRKSLDHDLEVDEDEWSVEGDQQQMKGQSRREVLKALEVRTHNHQEPRAQAQVHVLVTEDSTPFEVKEVSREDLGHAWNQSSRPEE